MRTIYIFGILLLATSLSSCRKDYVCTCTSAIYENSGIGYQYPSDPARRGVLKEYQMKKPKKKEAEESCAGLEEIFVNGSHNIPDRSAVSGSFIDYVNDTTGLPLYPDAKCTLEVEERD